MIIIFAIFISRWINIIKRSMMIQIRDCILQSHHLGYRKINLEQIKGIYIVLELTVQKNRLVIVLQLQPWESTFFRVDVTLAYSPSLFLNTIIFNRYGNICEREWMGLLWLIDHQLLRGPCLLFHLCASYIQDPLICYQVFIKLF